jgi:hypothetical protein
MTDTITLAHVGIPFNPPEINTVAGPVIFFPNPDGGPLWLGEATQEQADDLLQHSFFTAYAGATPVVDKQRIPIPDKTWSKPGIAQWALEFLGVTLDITQTKAQMLEAIAAAQVASESSDTPTDSTTETSTTDATVSTADAPTPAPEAAQ